MRILLGLMFLSFNVYAIPDEILTGYLEHHEICVKDASIRAPNQNVFNEMKESCRQEYINRVEGGVNSREISQDQSIHVKLWDDFINDLKDVPEFRIEKTGFFSKRAVLSDFYVTRDRRSKDRLLLWKNGSLISNYYALPFSEKLFNARYSSGRIAILGLDSINYYAVKNGSVYRMETEYGQILKLSAAIYLENNAIIVYNDQVIGVISRNVIKEID